MTALWTRWEFSATSCLSPSTQFSFSMCPVIWIRWLGANQLQVSLIGVLVVLKTFKTMVLISHLPYERLLHGQTILYISRNRCGCRVRINDSLGTFFFLYSFFGLKILWAEFDDSCLCALWKTGCACGFRALLYRWCSTYYTHVVISAGYNQLQLSLLFWLLWTFTAWFQFHTCPLNGYSRSRHICMSRDIAHVDAGLGYEWPSLLSLVIYMCIYAKFDESCLWAS